MKSISKYHFKISITVSLDDGKKIQRVLLRLYIQDIQKSIGFTAKKIIQLISLEEIQQKQYPKTSRYYSGEINTYSPLI